jgi:O-methyltransferase involved in polyketide biosynthesis
VVTGSGAEVVGGGCSERQQRIDTSVAHSARRYDYWLGGKENYAADRASGDQVAAAFPTIRTAVLENRGFLRRVVTFLAREAGIRQFLDLGTGLPTSPNVHEVAQGIDPACRVVYVDNDPIVLVHARALLTSSPEGATAYIDADLREPDTILAHPDLTQPVGLLLISVLHFITDDDAAAAVVARLTQALAPGSYLALSATTRDFMPPGLLTDAEDVATQVTDPVVFRSAAQLTGLLGGLELVPPGLQPTAEWRADDEPQPRPNPADISMYAAVARIP